MKKIIWNLVPLKLKRRINKQLRRLGVLATPSRRVRKAAKPEAAAVSTSNS